MHPHPGQPDVTLHGRIDGLTAAAVRKSLDEASGSSSGLITVDLSQVSYLSSAGLRVFLQVQKALKKAGGEMVLVSPPPCVIEILRISGMDKFFTLQTGSGPLQPGGHPPIAPPPDDLSGHQPEPSVLRLRENGYTIEIEQYPAIKGELTAFGNPELLSSASFLETDVHRLTSGRFDWGAGIGASGETTTECRALYGESVILSGHFFSYPAVRRPSVDYILHHKTSANPLHFLYGFGFSGPFCALGTVELEPAQGNPKLEPGAPDLKQGTLEGLLSALSGLLNLPAFGVVLAGQSDGLFGMHLRRSPAMGPVAPGTSVFDPDLFPQWFSFPAEPDDFHTIVVATGLYASTGNTNQTGTPVTRLIPAGSCCHLHAAVMEYGLMNHDPRGLTKEVNRILQEFEPRKVVHLLPASRISKGIIGIIPL